MIFSRHRDARCRMLRLIRQHMNPLISGNSQDSLRRHDFSNRASPRSRKANTTRNRHPYRVTFRDHRHHLDRGSGRRNRWCSHRANHPRTATIRALERYRDQILIRSRFVYPAQTPSLTGTRPHAHTRSHRSQPPKPQTLHSSPAFQPSEHTQLAEDAPPAHAPHAPDAPSLRQSVPQSPSSSAQPQHP